MVIGGGITSTWRPPRARRHIGGVQHPGLTCVDEGRGSHVGVHSLLDPPSGWPNTLLIQGRKMGGWPGPLSSLAGAFPILTVGVVIGYGRIGRGGSSSGFSRSDEAWSWVFDPVIPKPNRSPPAAAPRSGCWADLLPPVRHRHSALPLDGSDQEKCSTPAALWPRWKVKAGSDSDQRRSRANLGRYAGRLIARVAIGVGWRGRALDVFDPEPVSARIVRSCGFLV